MSTREELVSLIGDDPLGLLHDEKPKAELSSEKSVLLASFEEVQSFVETHQRVPKSNTENINEFRLHARLMAIRSDPKKVRELQSYDLGGLLKGEEVKEFSLEDIIADDPLGLLDSEVDNAILKLEHVKPVERIRPDYLSRRKECKDFHLFGEMFATLNDELATRKRRLVKYNSADLASGRFYVLRGVLLFLQSIEGKVDNKQFESGKRDRFDGRTLCIFDNGTQSDMLFRSLDKAMQLDGYSISAPLDLDAEVSEEQEGDVTLGYIYVLRSLNSRVEQIADLYKIGHTTDLVAHRIKNARQESTYLFNDVEVMSIFRCLNMESSALEQTMHGFFSSVRLDIELADNSGNLYKPREWFQVPLRIIEDAIYLILEGKLNDFYYDESIQEIVSKE